MATPDALERLQTELELIAASLLPTEHLVRPNSSNDIPHDLEAVQLPANLHITSEESKYHLEIHISASYPAKHAVDVQVKSKDQGRDEAEGWREWVGGVVRDAEWDESDIGRAGAVDASRRRPFSERERERENNWRITISTGRRTPLYTILTDHFLPLLAPADTATSEQPTHDALAGDKTDASGLDCTPHHVLIVTHHLISPTKRKNLLHLSSSLNLVGFSKVGHPGILYATGGRDDLAEWLREVKSWNWLALRVRIAIEPIPDEHAGQAGASAEKVEKKQRGNWNELEKLGEAMEWLALRGREGILIDAGVGSR